MTMASKLEMLRIASQKMTLRKSMARMLRGLRTGSKVRMSERQVFTNFCIMKDCVFSRVICGLHRTNSFQPCSIPAFE